MYEPGLQLANTAKKRAAPRLTESARLFILKENKTGEMEKNYECVFSDRRGADRQKHGHPPLFLCKFCAPAGRFSHREHPDGDLI